MGVGCSCARKRPKLGFAAAYQDVRSDKTPTNWALLDYEVCVPLS